MKKEIEKLLKILRKNMIQRYEDYELPYRIKHFADPRQVSGFNKGFNKFMLIFEEEVKKIFREELK